MKKEINDKSFVKIPGWVVNRLHLTGDEAIVYSLILGYKDGFQEPVSYIMAWTGCGERTIQRILRQLVELGLLSRAEKPGETTSYKCTDPRKSDTPANLTPPQILRHTPANLTPPTPYYIDSIDNNNNNINECAPAHTCTREEEASGKEDGKVRVRKWILDNEEGTSVLLRRLKLITAPVTAEEAKRVLAPYIDEFYGQLLVSGRDDIDSIGRMEIKRHFASWIRKYIEITTNQQNQDNNGNTNRRGNSASGTREGVPYDEFAKQFLIGFNSGKKERGM